MGMLAKHPKTLFVGQSVKYDGQRMFKSYQTVPDDRRIEMPIAEDFQMGFCTGLALQGYIPICIFPRWDFLLLAANQLINHLDKIPLVSRYKPKVIIRTSVGSTKPFNAGPQHTQNYSKVFKEMLKTVEVRELLHPHEIYWAYLKALNQDRSSIIVEHMSLYG